MAKARFKASDFLNLPLEGVTNYDSDVKGVMQDPKAYYESLAHTHGTANDVDPKLIISMMNVESTKNPSAISKDKKGKPIAYGLMQLTQDVIDKYNVKDPLNPSESVRGGTEYMRDLLEKYDGDRAHALAAYHAGTVGYNKKGKDLSKMGPRTKAYVPNVLRALYKPGEND